MFRSTLQCFLNQPLLIVFEKRDKSLIMCFKAGILDLCWGCFDFWSFYCGRRNAFELWAIQTVCDSVCVCLCARSGEHSCLFPSGLLWYSLSLFLSLSVSMHDCDFDGCQVMTSAVKYLRGQPTNWQGNSICLRVCLCFYSDRGQAQGLVQDHV